MEEIKNAIVRKTTYVGGVPFWPLLSSVMCIACSVCIAAQILRLRHSS